MFFYICVNSYWNQLHWLEKCKFKLQWDTTICLLEWPRLNKQKLQYKLFARMQHRWSSHTLLLGMQNHTGTRQKIWQSLVKLNICLPYDLAIKTLRYLLKWNKNLLSHENWFTNVYSSFIYHPKLERTQSLSINECINKTVVHPGGALSNTNIWLLVHTATWMNLKCILQVKEADSRGPTVSFPLPDVLLCLFVKLIELYITKM